jgi:hypothetical protein
MKTFGIGEKVTVADGSNLTGVVVERKSVVAKNYNGDEYYFYDTGMYYIRFYKEGSYSVIPFLEKELS